MSVSERVYHYPGIASHILGTVGRITAEDAEYYDSMGYPMDAIVGRSGCELAFEEWLRGSDGEMVIEYDEHGDIINTYYETEPQGGHDVYLTIDIDLQIAAEEGLAENVASVESAEAGALTAIDPNTGELLAIASYPTYDLSVYSEIEYYSSLSSDKNKPLLNRALNEIYAPGSTYKIGMALAALEENNIDRNTRCSCNGTYPYLHHPTCLASHGNIDIVEAIKESCNIFFYTIGHELGIDRITPYTSALGLGKGTGVELGEKTGNIAGSEYRESIGGEWSAGDDLSASIGQSDHGYTPLQLSVYMASIVNGGSRYSAHILKAVKEFYTGDVIYEYKPEVVEKVDFSGETYSILIDAMGKVVDGNTSLTHNFKDVGADVGGKTGTAQVTGRKDYALFSGFAPLIAPEIVVSCVIEEGVHGYNASVGAASVFERYFDKKQEK
jgi:penicillin-binding protein 2